jgi:hypothetical protein
MKDMGKAIAIVGIWIGVGMVGTGAGGVVSVVALFGMVATCAVAVFM